MKNILVIALVSAIVSIVVVKVMSTQQQGQVADSKQTAYDQVMETKVIRCGYALWPALVEKDPNTGELSGTFVDYLEALSQQLGMTVEWTEELGFGNFVEALNVGRIDAMCSGTWTNATRGSVVDFIVPISYQGVSAFVRSEDRRFDNNLEAINNKNIKVSGIDGETSEEIARNFFSKADLVLLPQLSDASEMILNVTTGKADVVFTDRHTIKKFLEKNPGQLREVPAEYPLRLFGNPIAIKKGEYKLKQTLDNATLQLIHTGVIERILAKNEEFPGTFYRPAPMFQN